MTVCYNLRGLHNMSEQRLQQLEENLSRILEALKAHYAPEQVIVFGSLTTGHVTETSDLDLLIVKDTDKRFYDRIREVVKMCDYDIGVDFLVYTPKELAEAAKCNAFVRDEMRWSPFFGPKNSVLKVDRCLLKNGFKD
jgi:predicted nucleotidyltransferase